MSHHAMPPHTMPCHTMPSMPCHTMPCHTMPWGGGVGVGGRPFAKCLRRGGQFAVRKVLASRLRVSPNHGGRFREDDEDATKTQENATQDAEDERKTQRRRNVMCITCDKQSRQTESKAPQGGRTTRRVVMQPGVENTSRG